MRPSPSPAGARLYAAAEGAQICERTSWDDLLAHAGDIEHLQGGVAALSMDGQGVMVDGALEFSAYRDSELIGGVTVEPDGALLVYGDVERFSPMSYGQRCGEGDGERRYFIEVEAEGVRYYLFAE